MSAGELQQGQCPEVKLLPHDNQQRSVKQGACLYRKLKQLTFQIDLTSSKATVHVIVTCQLVSTRFRFGAQLAGRHCPLPAKLRHGEALCSVKFFQEKEAPLGCTGLAAVARSPQRQCYSACSMFFQPPQAWLCLVRLLL